MPPPTLPAIDRPIAVGQTLTSALLIHLTGGRIETHFHVFGSLAFLAFYRDWRVLVTASAVVAALAAKIGVPLSVGNVERGLQQPIDAMPTTVLFRAEAASLTV